MPAPAIWLIASGRTRPAGWLPALKAVKFGAPFRFMMASAMMDRAEFPVHKNRTLKRRWRHAVLFSSIRPVSRASFKSSIPERSSWRVWRPGEKRS